MKKIVSYVLWPVLAGALFALTVLALPSLMARYPDLFSFATLQQQSPPPAPPTMLSFSEAIKKASPAVVSISSNSQQQVVIPVDIVDANNNPHGRLYARIFEDSNTLGSGVIISPDGYIITSYHLFEAFPDESIITLHDQRNVEARIVAVDPDSDLALLKVDEENLPYIGIGPSRALEVGEIVLAIGNPRNIGQSVSLGIISALLNRGDDFVIQTDAAINPGNSGGALIDASGNLIGINSTIISESGGSEGIGFATPADRAIHLMEQYVASGPSGYLGVNSSDLVSVTARDMTVVGFPVDRVVRNSPADKAGIRQGDIITGLDGVKVDPATGGRNFIEVLSSHNPGETVNIELLRDGEFVEVEATLAIGEPMVTFDELRIIESGSEIERSPFDEVAPFEIPGDGGTRNN